MSVTIDRFDTDQDDVIIELSPEEFHTAAAEALHRVGLSYEELAEQARRHDFTSAQAQILWTSIGGTLDC